MIAREIKKSWYHWFLSIFKQISHNYCNISATKTSLEKFFCVKKSKYKPFVFIQVWDSWQYQYPKSIFFIDFARDWNFYLSTSTSSSSFIKISTKNVAILESIQLKKLSFFPLHQNVVRENRRKSFGSVFFSIFKSVFPQKHKLYLLNRWRNRKNFSCKNVSEGKIVNFCSLHHSPENPTFPKSGVYKDVARDSNFYYSATRSSDCSI